MGIEHAIAHYKAQQTAADALSNAMIRIYIHCEDLTAEEKIKGIKEGLALRDEAYIKAEQEFREFFSKGG